jgi:hypothetical protein
MKGSPFLLSFAMQRELYIRVCAQHPMAHISYEAECEMRTASSRHLPVTYLTSDYGELSRVSADDAGAAMLLVGFQRTGRCDHAIAPTPAQRSTPGAAKAARLVTAGGRRGAHRRPRQSGSVSSDTIGRWERGQHIPHPIHQRSLARLFGIRLVDLGFGDGGDEMRPPPASQEASGGAVLEALAGLVAAMNRRVFIHHAATASGLAVFSSSLRSLGFDAVEGHRALIPDEALVGLSGSLLCSIGGWTTRLLPASCCSLPSGTSGSRPSSLIVPGRRWFSVSSPRRSARSRASPPGCPST